jgi:hypothetical protein
MIKNLVVAGAIALMGTVALAAETKADSKRDVAQADAIKKIKFFEGSSTSYKLLFPANTQLVIIKGDSARNIWKSLSVKQIEMENNTDSAWYQKIAENVTCDRVHQKSENKHEYTCTMSLVDGVAGGGGAG